ncbi:MAG: Maf family protein [Thermodesulfobacteriota bacterium]|nr:Maf family protein [Thermodesulfobacteriota bacterium]
MDRQKQQGGFVTRQRLILASSSPRRARFFRDLGFDFEVQSAEIDESLREGESPAAFVQRLAGEKASIIAGRNSAAWVVGADTSVVLAGRILGKPDSQADACRMLQMLSGRWHEVWTGFAIYHYNKGINVRKAVLTRVLFRELTPDLIHSYVLTGEPMDKAGSYGIQGKGGFLVRKIEGSCSNVIGLPLNEVVEEMLKLHVISPCLK